MHLFILYLSLLRLAALFLIICAIFILGLHVLSFRGIISHYETYIVRNMTAQKDLYPYPEKVIGRLRAEFKEQKMSVKKSSSMCLLIFLV